MLARDIPGNASTVIHRETGLLFSSPDGFLHELESVLHEPRLRETIIAGAKERLRLHHSPKLEQEGLLKILRRVVHQL